MSIFNASINGNLKKLKKMINNENINELNLGFTCLHYAAFYGKFKIVKYLIEECDADFEIRTLNGSTAFLLAVINNHYKIINYLLNIVDISIPNNDGYNALHMAIYNNNLHIIKILLSVNKKDEIWINPYDKTKDVYKYNAMELALFLNKMEIYNFLIDYIKKNDIF